MRLQPNTEPTSNKRCRATWGNSLAAANCINLLPCELHPRLWQTLLSTMKVGSGPPPNCTPILSATPGARVPPTAWLEENATAEVAGLPLPIKLTLVLQVASFGVSELNVAKSLFWLATLARTSLPRLCTPAAAWGSYFDTATGKKLPAPTAAASSQSMATTLGLPSAKHMLPCLTCPSAVISHTPLTLLHCLNSTLPASSSTQRPDTSCKLPALVNPNTSWPPPATMASTQGFALKPPGVDTTHCSWIAAAPLTSMKEVGGSNSSYCWQPEVAPRLGPPHQDLNGLQPSPKQELRT